MRLILVKMASSAYATSAYSYIKSSIQRWLSAAIEEHALPCRRIGRR